MYNATWGAAPPGRLSAWDDPESWDTKQTESGRTMYFTPSGWQTFLTGSYNNGWAMGGQGLELDGQRVGPRGYVGPQRTNPDLYGFSRPSSNMTFAGVPVETTADLYQARAWNVDGEPGRWGVNNWMWFRLWGLVPNSWPGLVSYVNLRAETGSTEWERILYDFKKCLEDRWESETGFPFRVHPTMLYPAARAGIFDMVGCPLPAGPVSSHPGDYSGPAMPELTGRPSSGATEPKEETTTEATPEEEPEDGQGQTGREPGVVHDPSEPEQTELTPPTTEIAPPPDPDAGPMECVDGYTWDADLGECVPVGGPTTDDGRPDAGPESAPAATGAGNLWWLLAAAGAYYVARRR